MLNEIIEASEYLYDFKNTDNGPKRIKRTVLLWQNSFLGLERILMIIARYFIYEDGVEYDEGLKRADAAIRMWCGHTSDGKIDDRLSEEYEYLKENYPWIEYWLPDYLRETAINETEKEMEIVEKGIAELMGRKKSFSVSSLNKSPNKNDFKAIRYDKIVSNAAVSRGPLKRYYLACSEAEWDIALRKEGGRRPTQKQKDYIIKTIAAYMLERSLKQRADNSPRFEPINYMDITNWAEISTRLYKNKYKTFVVSGRPLFTFQSGFSGNTAKIKPDRKWFEACGWQLIDATDDDSELDAFLDENPEGIYYRDSGSCVPLEPRLRYER